MMIPRRLRVINWNQKGFTLAEIIIAIAITALVGSAVATATFQVIKVNASSTNHQIAVSQVQNAVNSISRDAQQAQQIIPAGPTVIVVSDAINNTTNFNLVTGDTLTVQWIDWNDNTTHQAVYTYDVANGVLLRTMTIGVGAPSTITVANNISVASGDWNTDLTTYTRTLTLQIEAIVGASNPATETRTFQIIPRPAQ